MSKILAVIAGAFIASFLTLVAFAIIASIAVQFGPAAAYITSAIVIGTIAGLAIRRHLARTV